MRSHLGWNWLTVRFRYKGSAESAERQDLPRQRCRNAGSYGLLGVARKLRVLRTYRPEYSTVELPTYIALSRLAAQSRAMDVGANNMANADTPGFKASRTLFSDWLSSQRDARVPPGGRTIAFTQDRATYRDQQAGALQHTGNPLDLALGGTGFFTVSTPRGPRLTRAGHFVPQADGTLSDESGNAVLDTAGKPIRLAPGDIGITITADGTVSTATRQIGRIGVVQPLDPNRLAAEGSRLLRADTPTQPVAKPAIVQGAIESSNVQPIVEMVGMMKEMREFQFTTQFVQSESDRAQKAIDTLLKTAA